LAGLRSVLLVLLIGPVGARTTAHIDGDSWAALADPTATVGGDGTHRAALLRRLCRRAAAGVWEPCSAGEGSPVLLVAPEDKSFALLPVQQQRKGATHLYSTLIEAETLARVPSQWVHHIYRAEEVGGVQRYRDVPAELLRAEQYPSAPHAGPHKNLFSVSPEAPARQMLALNELAVRFLWLRAHEVSDSSGEAFALPVPSYALEPEWALGG
jgi:hypothetical protein